MVYNIHFAMNIMQTSARSLLCTTFFRCANCSLSRDASPRGSLWHCRASANNEQSDQLKFEVLQTKAQARMCLRDSLCLGADVQVVFHYTHGALLNFNTVGQIHRATLFSDPVLDAGGADSDHQRAEFHFI